MSYLNEIEIIIRKNFKFLLLGAISLLIFHQYIVLILLLIFFTILGVMTLKVSQLVPHISIESVSASAILLGYVWDWKIALAFGVVVGLFGYTKISQLRLKAIVSTLFMGLSGVMGDLFHTMGYSFFWTFIIIYLIRSNLGFFVFYMLEPNVTENIMHSYGDAIFNVLITVQLMQFIYFVVRLLVPA